MKKIAIVVLTLLMVACVAGKSQSRSAIAAARVLYVATTGSDSNPGTSTAPFRTIQHGLDVAGPGDTVKVASGIYAPASFTHSGVPGSPITLSGVGANVRFIGDGSSNDTGGTGLSVRGHDIVVRHISVTGFSTGIGVNGSNIIVRGSTSFNNSSEGILCVHCSYVRIIYNRVMDLCPSCSGAGFQDYGVAVYYSDHVRVNHNYFAGRHNQTLSFKRIDTNGQANWNVFEGCLLTCLYLGQNDDDSSGDQTAQNLVALNNTFRAATVNGTFYSLRTPITVRNVNGAVVEHNRWASNVQYRRVFIYWDEISPHHPPFDIGIIANPATWTIIDNATA